MSIFILFLRLFLFDICKCFLIDEGVYCQSLCTSSNVSGRSSSSSRLITNSNPIQQSYMPNNKQPSDVSTHRVRFQGLPRSQTTNGISDVRKLLFQKILRHCIIL